jgi:hypothetical protein
MGGSHHKNGRTNDPKKIINGKCHNTKAVGRPRTRWEDVVQSDALQVLRIRGGRRQARDREEWRHLLREARVQKGMEHHTWMNGSCIRIHSANVLPLMERTKHHQASSSYKTSKIIVPYI